MSKEQRTLCWFSCGAASAVAAKLVLEDQASNVIVVNCDTRSSEHPDNYRFTQDVERWLGVNITHIKSSKYDTIDDVFERERYMSGIGGARCTTELKKIPRLKFQNADDVHVFGFTADEPRRVESFQKRNPDMILRWPLVERGITKDDCYVMLREAGIELPAMYRIGFNNNNCPGCVKATSPWYWDMVRKHFPDIFAARARISREIGCRLVRVDGKRIFLDELPCRRFRNNRENVSCGPECGFQPNFFNQLEGEQ